jgi:hypothetical protein
MISQSTLTVKTETRTSETTVIMGLLSFSYQSLLFVIARSEKRFTVLSAKISGWGLGRCAGSTFNPVSKLAEKD